MEDEHFCVVPAAARQRASLWTPQAIVRGTSRGVAALEVAMTQDLLREAKKTVHLLYKRIELVRVSHVLVLQDALDGLASECVRAILSALEHCSPEPAQPSVSDAGHCPMLALQG
eukprot:3370397-Pyramimonas_sp.AAC.1